MHYSNSLVLPLADVGLLSNTSPRTKYVSPIFWPCLRGAFGVQDLLESEVLCSKFEDSINMTKSFIRARLWYHVRRTRLSTMVWYCPLWVQALMALLWASQKISCQRREYYLIINPWSFPKLANVGLSSNTLHRLPHWVHVSNGPCLNFFLSCGFGWPIWLCTTIWSSPRELGPIFQFVFTVVSHLESSVCIWKWCMK